MFPSLHQTVLYSRVSVVVFVPMINVFNHQSSLGPCSVLSRSPLLDLLSSAPSVGFYHSMWGVIYVEPCQPGKKWRFLLLDVAVWTLSLLQSWPAVQDGAHGSVLKKKFVIHPSACSPTETLVQLLLLGELSQDICTGDFPMFCGWWCRKCTSGSWATWGNRFYMWGSFTSSFVIGI